MITLRDYQSEIIEEVRSKWKEGKKRLVVCSPTGCHEKGYMIWMFDGTVKKVEDVVVGDELMGADGSKRTVLSLHRGSDMLYKVIPSEGNSFIVNGGHILPAKIFGEKFEISIDEYLELDNSLSSSFKIYKLNGVSFYFTVKPHKIGDYYGFTIDGDHLYCDWQGFVHHNSGKTVIFSYIAQQAAIKGSSILIITHRDELLTQTGGTLQEFNLNPTIITAAVKHPPKSNLYVAMTKTLSNRLKKSEWDAWYRKIDLVIIDEMHEQSFNWIFGNQHTQSKFVLGFSATPNRTGNQRQLSLDYEDMVIGKDVQELINLKYLVPDRYFCVPVDMKGVSKSQGDYNTEEMFSRYNRTELYAGVIDNWKRICPDTITIVFCCNIQHTINTCKAFNDAGIKAKFIVSDVAKPSMPENPDKADISKYKIKCDEYANYIENYSLYSGDRKEVINDWKNGEFKVLINAGIATTGFDHKPIQTVIMNRATTSDNLLLQCLDSETEILTNNGWKRHDAISYSDLVCGYDIKSGYSSYVPILNIVQRPINENESFYGIKNNYVDIRVTGGHRMILSTRVGCKDNRHYSEYRFCEAENITNEVSSAFVIPVSSKSKKENCGLSEWDLKLVGLILSDGCIRKEGVMITQSVENKTIPIIEEILEKSGVHYRKNNVKNSANRYENGKAMYSYYINKENKYMPNKGKKGLLGIWHLLDKTIPDSYDNLSSEDLKNIFYGYHVGNGDKCEKISWKRHTFTMCVSNERIADRFQQLMVTNGIKCSVSKNQDSPSRLLNYSYEKSYKNINTKSTDSRQLWCKLEKTENEIVWCVTNELSTLITRRNGKVSIVGNCLGRGSRISEGKEHFYILDFGENCKRLGYYRQQREYSLTHEVGKGGGGVPASKECPKCKSLVIASSTVCKYCGFIFPKTRKEEIVELREVDYTSAKKELQTIKDYELFAEAKGYSKNWLFRQIYIKWGKDGLVEYQKKNNLQPGWPYRMIAMYRAQGLRNNE